MSSQTLEENKSGTDAGFDRVVQLISECVVIKTQLQQFMDDLDGEKEKSRVLAVRAAALLDALRAAGKGPLPAAVVPQAEALQQSAREARLDAALAPMDEVVSRFGKVMGDLQHQLVSMNLGSSAIAILQVLLVRIHSQIYALPIESVQEIIKVKKSDIYPVDGAETISLRGHPLGVISVSVVIGMPGVENRDLPERKIVVLTDGDNRIGIMVDDLLGEESLVSKELPPQVRGVRGLRGASILGDGKIGLIIDTARLIVMAGGKG